MPTANKVVHNPENARILIVFWRANHKCIPSRSS